MDHTEFLAAVRTSHGDAIADQLQEILAATPDKPVLQALAEAVSQRLPAVDAEQLGKVRFDSKFESHYRDDWAGPKR